MIKSSLIPCLAIALAVGCAEVSHETASSSSQHLTNTQAIAQAIPEKPRAAEISSPSAGGHLTRGQAVAIAQPHLRVPEGDSYRAVLKDGVWEVWTDRTNSQYRGWTVVTIRDMDGQVLGVANRF